MSERPGIYLKFEVGVSWNPRQPPKNRQVTYMSKGMRDRAQYNSQSLNNHEAYYYYSGRPQQHAYFYGPNHLTAPAQDPSSRTSGRKALPPPIPRQSSSPGAYLQSRQPRDPARDTTLQPPEDRSRSRSSHERGSSAPPPGDRPWDAEPEPMAASALPRREEFRSEPQSGRPEIWKALPATPSEFRLDGPDLAWSPITMPLDLMGTEGDEAAEGTESRVPRTEALWPPAKSQRRLEEADDRERGQVKEMESLASALMTCDNGFEDQWWYQGPRLVNIAGDLIPSSVMRDYTSHGGTVGWAVADADLSAGISRVDTTRTRRSPSSAIDIVSPLSETASPVPSFVGLRRTLTTRSDELHM